MRCWSQGLGWIRYLHNTDTLITSWAASLHDRKSYTQQRNERFDSASLFLIAFTEYIQNARMNVKPPDEGKMYFYSIPFLHLRKQQCYVSSSSVNFIPKSENMPEGLPNKLTLKKIFSYLWKPQETQGKRQYLRIIQIITS